MALLSLETRKKYFADLGYTYDEEGIKKLYEAFDGDLTEFADKLTAIQEAGTEYTSFAGANKDEDCSVKFIIKTEGVKAEDI